MDHADKAAKPKKRRTGQIVFLCILLLLLAVLGGVVWRYRAGLAILIDNFGKSSEQVSAEREDYEKKTQALLDKLSGGGITLAALSEADRARLKNGEITPAEAVAIIMGLAGSTAAESTAAPTEPPSPGVTTVPAETTAPAGTTVPAETTAPAGTTVPAETTAPAATTAPVTPVGPATSDATTEVTVTAPATSTARSVEDVISEIYLLRAEFLNKIDLMIADGTAEVEATPKEKRTLTFKIELMNRYMDRGNALEKECDARMELLLAELETALRQSGGDLSLIDEVRALYAQEKKLYKAELYQKYT